MKQQPKLNDDETLLRMHEEGKTLKEIGEHYGCSATAVHKRLKRLLSTVKVAEVLSEHGLTGQRAEYALLRGQGLKPKQAALALCDVTSDDSARNRASQLEKSEGVREAIVKLLDMHIPREHRILTLRSLVDSRLPDIQLKALDQTWKLGGEYAANPYKASSCQEINLPLNEKDVPFVLPYS